MYNESFIQNGIVTEVATDILCVDFLTEEYCEYLVTACKVVGNWTPHPADKFATHDIHFETEMAPLYETFKSELITNIFPKISNYWDIDPFLPDDIFALKYAEETQTSLDLHHDESYISCSVKLNEDYEGAVLEFPRQEFSNADIHIGELICWPSKITHPHRSTPLTHGEKFSLTIWTKDE